MKEPLEQKSREGLEREIIELKRQLVETYEMIRKLSEQIEELQRAGKRQAVPFARREEQRVKKPRKRGRKPGKGQYKNCEKPKEEEISETKRAELSGCPECQCELIDVKEQEQYEIDIPEIKPIIKRYIMLSGKCQQCGKWHKLCHPGQISEAVGASGVVVGPHAKALASNLKHELGVSYGKVSRFVNDVFHLNVTRGAWQQAGRPTAGIASPAHLQGNDRSAAGMCDGA